MRHFDVRRILLLLWAALAIPSTWAQSPPVFSQGPNFGTWSIGEIQIPLSATGGNGTYSWSVISGSLPTGVALRTDPETWFPASASAGLIGVATTPGTYNFRLSVTSAGLTTNQDATLKVSALTVKDLFTLPDSFANVPFSYTLTALGNAGPVTWTPTSALPPGMNLSSAGVLSGTPTVPNTSNINFTVSDGVDTVSRSVQLLVWTTHFTSPAVLPNATQNAPYSTTVTAAGGTGSFTFTANNPPSGLTMSPSGVISGTVTAGPGNWYFSVTATDTNNVSYTKNVSIDIIGVPAQLPVITPYFDDCTIGVSCSREIFVGGGGTAPFSWAASGLPPGMSIRSGSGASAYVASGAAEVWGTPTALGTYNVQLTVTDANGTTATNTFPLHVSALLVDGNDFLPSGTIGVPYSHKMRVIGGTIPAGLASYTAAALGGQAPGGLVFFPNTFLMSGLPTDNGQFNVIFKFTDGGGNTLQITDYFNIAGPNGTNITINNAGNLGTYQLGSSVNIQLSACCVSSYLWSLAGGSLPAGVFLTPTGVLSGTATPLGNYTFLVKAADASNPSNFGLRQFTLAVSPISFVTGGLSTGNVGSPYSVSFAATGGVGGLTWTVAPFTGSYLPPGMTLTPGGLLSGTPTGSGQYFFQVTATDSVGNATTRFFSLSIYPAGAFPPPAISNGSDFGTFSIGELQIALTATGGNGTYSWSLTGTLPPGISLRTDPETWFPASASAGLVGVATTPGTYNFTLSVTSAGQTTTLPFKIKIAKLLVKDYWNVPDAFVTVPFSYTLAALNNAGPVTWTATGGLPPGITLSSTGVLSGTPTTAGFYSPSFSLTDGVDTVSRSVNLNVSAIQITSPGALPNATLFALYSVTVAASGGSGSFTFTADSLPTGLTLSPAGLISGTPTGQPQRYAFNLTATDTNNVSYTKVMSINAVDLYPQLPRILSDANPIGNFDDCTIGVPCSRGFAIRNGGAAPYSWTATGLPPGMSMRTGIGITSCCYAPGDAELWGTPTATGTFNIQMTLTDGNGLIASNTFPLHVSPLTVDGNDYLPSGTIGVPYSHKMRVLGGTIPAGLASYTATLIGNQLPAGLTYNPSTFVVSGTPTENGSFDAVFNFTDAGGNSFQTTSYFNINGVGTTIAITTADSLGPYAVGQNPNLQLAACCVPSYTWSFISGTMPPGLTLSSSGLLSGSLTTAGTYTFTVHAADATNPGNFGTRVFTLVVSPLSFTTPGTLPFGNVGTFYSVVLAASGGTGTLTWSLAPVGNSSLPPGFTIAANGTFSGTPSATGQYAINLTVTDSAGHSNTARFNLFIYAAGANPPLNLPLGPFIGPNILGPQTFQLAATGGQGPYHYSLTPSAIVIPGMRVQDGQPLPTSFPSTTTGAYFGTITTPGVYTTSIRVTDSLGATFDRAITITISPLDIVSQSTTPRATLNTPYSFTLVPFGGSGNYSWSATNLPPGLTINSSGQISGTPTLAGGNFTPTITLTDLSTSNSVSIGHTIAVDPFAMTTGGVLPPGTIGIAYSKTLTAPNCGSGCTWTALSLVGGLSLSSGGVLSGTPSVAANTSFSIQASGSNGAVVKTFSIVIASTTVQPLSIVNGNTSPTYVTVGTLANSALVTSGGVAPYTWSVQSGTLPTGFTLNSPGENFGSNFAPGFTYLSGRAMQVGTFNFTLQVTDGANTTATKSFSWIVTPLQAQYTNLPLSGKPLVYNLAYTQPLLVIGGTGSYTWTTTTAMPPGLTLNSSTGVVSGTPTNTGSFNVTIQVTDTGGNSTVFNLNFSISSPSGTTVAINAGPNLGPVQQGFLSSTNLNPTGGTGPYAFTALTPLPPGFAIESGNAILQGGTPGTSYFLAGMPLATGAFTFTLQATDSLGNIGVKTFTLSVSPITVNTTTLNDASVGVPYSQQIPVFDSAGPVSWSVNSNSIMPPGMNVSTAGVINGTPTQAGTFSFTLNATDSTGLIVAVGFSLRVSNISIGGPSILPQAIVGVPYTYPFTATGGAGTLTWTVTGLPSGLTMSGNGVISGTPDGPLGSTSALVVTATDGVVPVSKRVTLFTRTPNATQFSIFVALPDATVGQNYAASLAAINGGIPPYTWSVASGSTLPPGFSLLSGAALPANFTPGSTVLAGVPSTAGNYTFDLIATDSIGAQLRRTATLNVSAIGILSGLIRTAIINTAYAEQFTAVGGTGPYAFTASPFSLVNDMLPPGVNLSPGGLLSGTPTSTGNYFFILKAQDTAGNTYSRNYTLTVTNSSGLFVTSSNPADDSVGINTSIQLFAQGSSTYTWTVVSGTPPPGLTLVSPTVAQGAPNAPGTYTFTLRATDNGNPANFADHVFTFRVSPMQVVSPTSVLASRFLPAGQMGVPYSFTFKMAGGTPPYTFVESPFLPMPPGLTLSSTGVVSGSASIPGVYVIQPIVSDSAGNVFNSSPVSFSITKPGAPQALVASNGGSPANVSVGVGQALTTFELDQYIQAGNPPYSWSITSGSLPPGWTLLPGSNGVSTYLGGIATTAGTFSFSLTVTDSSGQTLTFPVDLEVVPVNLSPGSLPPGKVGTVYSAILTPSGGTGPYTIQTLPGSSMPPGLTLSASGVLSGTPTYPGGFNVTVSVTDSASLQYVVTYTVTIDDAAGESPALSLTPSSIQGSYIQGTPVPGPTHFSIASTSGALPFTLSVSGLPGATLSTTSGTTPGTSDLSLNLPALSAGTYFGVVAATAPQSTNVIASAPVTIIVASPPVCTYTLNPSSRTAALGGGLGNFSVSTGSLCSWTATPSDPWITITSGASGTGVGTVNYHVAANATGAGRDGTITVNGQVFTIEQFGPTCSFGISNANMSAPATGGTAGITITASNSACGWIATGLGATPPSGTGNGVTTVTIPPNASASTQTLTATIAGQTLTVTQQGINCTVSLGSSSASALSSGGVGSVTVNTPAGCSYNTVPGPSWISVTSGGSGTGPGTLAFSVDPNSTTLSRTGALSIGGQAFQITQGALACSVSLDTSGLGSPYGSGGGTGLIGITTNGSNCSWNASSAPGFATVFPTSGTGNGTVGVTVTSNASSVTPRSTSITISGQTVPISQAGTTCTYGLQSAGASVPASGGSGSVGVIAAGACGWTSVSNTPSWLTITSSGSAGSADVQFNAQANTNMTPRTGTLTIAGLTYTVTQAGAVCSYSLSPANITVSSGGASSASFTISTASSGCSPAALSYTGWITVTNTTFSGTSGTVTYSVAANPAGTTRKGTIQAGDQTFTVTQTGAACAYSLQSYGAVFSQAGSSGAVLGSPSALGCTPDDSTNQPSFILLQPLSGPVLNIFTVPFNVTQFNSLTNAVRIGNITFGGQIFTVKQTSW